jgi:hypothetical protein
VELTELMAREAIRDLIARYSAGVDGNRLDDVVALFATDALVEFGGESYVGREGILRMYTANGKKATGVGIQGRVQHMVTSTTIELGATTSRARSYMLVMTGSGIDHWGRYLDEFARFGEHWLFAKRRIYLDGITPGGFGAAIS